MMKKFLYQLLIVGIIFLLNLLILDFWFTAEFKEGKTNKTQWLYKKKNEHFDLAIIGSSRAWWNIDLNKINESLQLNCISLANNHFTYSEMLLRLKQFYQNGNSIDQLLMQTEYYEFFKNDKKLSISAYDNIPFLDDSITYNHLKEKSFEWVKLKYVPFWRYAEYNRQWGVEEFLISKLGIRNTIFDSTGSFFSNDKFYGKDSIEFGAAETNQPNQDFKELIKFCNNKNIKVLIYTAPIYHAIINPKSQEDLRRQLASMNIAYRDFTHLYTDSTKFNDNTHLSIKGGQAFTNVIIEYLKK